MLQLIYLSVATREITPSDLVSLCEQATRNNQRDEVTGMLMEEDGHFLQAIEGPRETIEDTFLRIMGDDRHRRVTLLHRQLTTRREFGEWAMVACDRSAERRSFVGAVRDRIAHGPAHLSTALREAFPLS